MQAVDTDRQRQDGGWEVKCAHCGQWFESKRSDASYCNSRCRLNASREPQKMANYIAYLDTVGAEARGRASRRSKSKALYEAMLKLQSDISKALAEFEAE